MSEMGNRRTGGREGRRAVRLSHQVERLPFLTRTLAPFVVLPVDVLAFHIGLESSFELAQQRQ